MIAGAFRTCMIALGVFAADPSAVLSNVDAFRVLSIPNYHLVSPGISRGGRPRLDDVRSLKSQGFKTIINLQGRDYKPGLGHSIRVYQPGERRSAIENERRLTESLGMSYFNLPFNSLMPVSEADAANIMKAVAILADPASHPVFIHCEHGRDRTGLIVALMRILHEGWTVQQAHDEWVKFGHDGWLTLKFTGNLDIHFRNTVRAAGFEI